MSTNPTDQAWIIVLTPFPPRAGSIATFSYELCKAFDQLFAPQLETRIMAMTNKDTQKLVYADKIIGQILQSRRGDYVAMAQQLNHDPKVKLVSIQHEFGLYSGPNGDYLLTFVATLRKPLVITFHTISPTPDQKLHKFIKTLVSHAHHIVVMTEVCCQILIETYSIGAEKITVIPLSIAPDSLELSPQSKQQLKPAADKTMAIAYMSVFKKLLPALCSY